MDGARWRRIEAVFEQAIELPERERSGFLDRACGGDAELRGEVAVLLANAAPTSGALRDAIVAEIEMVTRSAAPAAQIGRRFGPFRLIRLLGEGGMGAVYLAERDDAQFAQRVALKILSRSVGSPAAIARFRDERQILAALQHPSIVRLLDGGSTEDGLPYLVMEYIAGTAITEYADAQKLSVRDRVVLVRRVCAALHYAHQNLVIHRDIKPGNILVDQDGVPKILDFGIAKLLAPLADFAPEAQTRTGFALFTPEYASPEQARGDVVSTATDVYSVGGLLYVLVTGRPPHVAEGGMLETLRVICEIDPPRPSTIGPRRELVGDLDNIILKALHKDPDQRYASIEQLSEDLGRFLDGLPVAARTATMSYRARKFVRRNKTAVAATTLVAAALLASTAVSLRQAHRADDQAARAEAERARAIEAAARAEVERRRAIEAAERAEQEATRARAAEATVTKQLQEIRAAVSRRDEAELLARTESAKATEQAQIARQAVVKAGLAERHAQTADQEAQVLQQREGERAKQREQRRSEIITAAQLPAVNGAAPNPRAVERYQEGNAEFAESHFAQALAKYEDAVRNGDHPMIRFNMALCLMYLNRLVEARDHLERSMAHGAGALGGDDGYGRAQAQRKALESKLARVELVCRAPDAEISLDGKLVLKAPGTVVRFVLPGEHQVVVGKAGFQTMSRTVVLVAGKPMAYEVRPALELAGNDVLSSFELGAAAP